MGRLEAVGVHGRTATGGRCPGVLNKMPNRSSRYGTRRLQVEFREKGHRVGRQALRTGLRRHERRASQPKVFAPRTTDSTHGRRCAPNLLLDQPRPTQANQGRADGALRPGWPVCGQRLQGPAARRPGLTLAQPTRRMRRQCAGRKPTKGFKCLWSRLKTEELEACDWPVFADLAGAQASVAAYFDYYNHERRHFSRGYQNLVNFTNSNLIISPNSLLGGGL